MNGSSGKGFRCRLVGVLLCGLMLLPAENIGAKSPAQGAHLVDAGARSLIAFPNWSRMLSRHHAEMATDEGSCGDAFFVSCHLRDWRRFLASLHDEAPMRQLELVNRHLNRTPYVPDENNYRLADYWATPRQFLSLFGDCEDFAIAKFMSLWALGWPNDSLRIVVVEDTEWNRRHAVLVAFLGGESWVLDNDNQEILPLATARTYRPLYSVNEEGGWYHRP